NAMPRTLGQRAGEREQRTTSWKLSASGSGGRYRRLTRGAPTRTISKLSQRLQSDGPTKRAGDPRRQGQCRPCLLSADGTCEASPGARVWCQKRNQVRKGGLSSLDFSKRKRQ